MGRTRTLRRAVERAAAKLERQPLTPHVWKTATAVRIEAPTWGRFVLAVWRFLRTPRMWRAVWRGLPPSVLAHEKNRLLVRCGGRTLLRIPQR